MRTRHEGKWEGSIVPCVPSRDTRRRKVFSFHPATLRLGKVPLGASEQEGGRAPEPDWKPERRKTSCFCQESKDASLEITITITNGK